MSRKAANFELAENDRKEADQNEILDNSLLEMYLH
jgi:hypothetical protein